MKINFRNSGHCGRIQFLIIYAELFSTFFTFSRYFLIILFPLSISLTFFYRYFLSLISLSNFPLYFFTAFSHYFITLLVSLLSLPNFSHSFLSYCLSLFSLNIFSFYFLWLLSHTTFSQTLAHYFFSLTFFHYFFLLSFTTLRERLELIDFSSNILVAKVVFSKSCLSNEILLYKSQSSFIRETSFSIL